MSRRKKRKAAENLEGKRVIILRGRRRGEHARVHQAANDWVMLHTIDGQSVVLNRSSVQPVFANDERLN
jgi:hypothetical protein